MMCAVYNEARHTTLCRASRLEPGHPHKGLSVYTHETPPGQYHSAAGFSLPVRWPNGQLLHHRACPAHGYNLCYSAQPGKAVTLFTARKGLRVKMYGGGEEGVLVQPMEVSPASGGGVVWLVDFSGGGDGDGLKLTYLMTRHYAEPTWHATRKYDDASELGVGACVRESHQYSAKHRMRVSNRWVPASAIRTVWWVQAVILGNRNGSYSAVELHLARGRPPRTNAVSSVLGAAMEGCADTWLPHAP